MAHRLTGAELARIRAAFINWDTTGAGAIPFRDVCRLMEALGETPSRTLQKLSARPDAEDERVTFDEFLICTFGRPWEATGPDTEEQLIEAMEVFDDGTGYVPLQHLMRVVHEHLAQSGYHLTDGDLVDVYRQALDGSVFATAGGRLAPENMWRVFEEEFATFRKGQRTEKANSAIAGEASRKCSDLFARLRRVHTGPAKCFRHLCSQLGGRSIDSAACKERSGDGESSDGTALVINLTVVDLGGKQLMFDAVASTWSVQELQQHIEKVVGVPVHRQHLFLSGDDGFGHELRPSDACLSEAGVVDGITLLLVVNGEVKLDYKQFISRLMDVDLEHPRARAQTYGRGA